jgi:hypothetical protein
MCSVIVEDAMSLNPICPSGVFMLWDVGTTPPGVHLATDTDLIDHRPVVCKDLVSFGTIAVLHKDLYENMGGVIFSLTNATTASSATELLSSSSRLI